VPELTWHAGVRTRVPAALGVWPRGCTELGVLVATGKCVGVGVVDAVTAAVGLAEIDGTASEVDADADALGDATAESFAALDDPPDTETVMIPAPRTTVSAVSTASISCRRLTGAAASVTLQASSRATRESTSRPRVCLFAGQDRRRHAHKCRNSPLEQSRTAPFRPFA
jgi:hypothetical protein